MIYLAGSGPFNVQTPMAGGTGITTGGGDAAWTSTCIIIYNTGAVALTKTFGPITEGWVHFEAGYAGRGWNNNFVACLYSPAGVPLIRIYAHTFQVWTGAAWVSNGSLPVSGGGQYDIYFKAHATEGVVQLYYNKELVGFFNGNTAHISVDHVRFGNPVSFGGDIAVYSQLLVADFPTLFAKVKQTLFTTQGNYNEWTGTVDDIKEALPDVASSISTPTVDAKETFKAPARNFAGYTVRGLLTHFAGLRGGAAAPPKIRAMLRIGGADYYGAAKDLDFGKMDFTEYFDVNPATGSAWTAGEAGSADLEVGVQARA